MNIIYSKLFISTIVTICSQDFFADASVESLFHDANYDDVDSEATFDRLRCTVTTLLTIEHPSRVLIYEAEPLEISLNVSRSRFYIRFMFVSKY